MLQFDKEALSKEILRKLEIELKDAFKSWQNEVIRFMNYNEFKKNAETDFLIKNESKKIIAYLEANTYVLADSYGTGSLMLLDNPGYKEYRNSKEWNPDRTNNSITGRRAGDYTDIFGRKHHTSGIYKGETLEGRYVRGRYKIEPVSPSRAVEAALGWLYKTYLPRAYKLAINNINFSKYLVEK